MPIPKSELTFAEGHGSCGMETATTASATASCLVRPRD